MRGENWLDVFFFLGFRIQFAGTFVRYPEVHVNLAESLKQFYAIFSCYNYWKNHRQLASDNFHK